MYHLLRLAGVPALVLASTVSALAWGAIAVDDTKGMTARQAGWGYATRRSTAEDAITAAMNQCRQGGNDHCRLVLQFHGCGAYAASLNMYGTGTGRSRQGASANALASCRRGGERGCAVAVATCE